MKKILLSVFLVFSFISVALCDVYVNGYYKKDGTYVEPHYRSNPDGNQYNNWSTKGNVNPSLGSTTNKITKCLIIKDYLQSIELSSIFYLFI
jgi:hypothetical protein